MFITESDTRAKYIDTKLKASGWEEFVVKEYYFTDGRKLLGADSLLPYKNTNLAIIYDYEVHK